MSELIDLLHQLSEILAPSGHEAAVRRVLRTLLEGHVDEINIDAMGNLLVLKRGTGASPLKVMVDAHMDEVGLMIVDHTGDGNLKFRTFGNIDPRLMPGQTVVVGKDRLPGVIGLQAIHHVDPGDMERVTGHERLTIDIGAGSKEEAAGLAPIGTMAGFPTTFRTLGNFIAGKSFDDRAGCAILVELLRGPRRPYDLYGVFSVQEEVGLRGARVAAYTVAPDLAIALEATIADDLPKDEDVSPTTRVGSGAALTVRDGSYVADPRLVQLSIQAATAAGLPYQIKQPGISGTNAGSIHLTRGGVPSITIAVPCRYIHSPLAVLNPDDLENTYRLISALLDRLPDEWVSDSAAH